MRIARFVKEIQGLEISRNSLKYLYDSHGKAVFVFWGDRRDLNPRQPEPQSGVLPTELRPPLYSFFKGFCGFFQL